MPNYRYTATSNIGEKTTGVIKAANKEAAIVELRNTIGTVNSIKEAVETKDIEIFKPTINEKNLALVCQQFSIILNAGLPITMAIQLVANQTEDKYLKKLLMDVSDDVKGGKSLANAFEDRDSRLSSVFVESIRAGELSGNLDKTFVRLTDYFTNKSTVSSKVKSALIYPAFVIVLGVIVIAIIMIVAVPMFTETFAELGTELPLPTKLLIALSNFATKWTWLIALIVAIFVLAYVVYSRTEKGRLVTEEWKLKMPILGKVRMLSVSSEFANSFATMLTAGLPVIKALRITAKSLSNYYVTSQVNKAAIKVEGGYKIGASLKRETSLPELLTEVIGVGEESGSLEKVLDVMAKYYDNEAQTATNNAVKILEPSIVIVLAVFVVFILLAVYLPMFSMYSSIS